LSFDCNSVSKFEKESSQQDDLKKKKTKWIPTVTLKKKSLAKVSTTATNNNNDERLFEETALQIQELLVELRQYEQLSGRRSCFDVEELELTFADQFSKTKGVNSSRLALILKFLTQLVSRTMSYLLQSQIEIQKMSIQAAQHTATTTENEPTSSENDVANRPLESIHVLSSTSSLVPEPEPTSPFVTDAATDHKTFVGGTTSPFTDRESPNAQSSFSHKSATESPANLNLSTGKTSAWTPETTRRSRSPARIPNGTSASDWLFSHPASKMTPTAPSSQRNSATDSTRRVSPTPVHRGLLLFSQSPTPVAATMVPEREDMKYTTSRSEKEFIEIESFTPMASSLASRAPRKVKVADVVDRTGAYDAFYNLTQSKPLMKSSPLTTKESAALSQETPSMLFPRTTAAPTPYAPSKVVNNKFPSAGGTVAYLSPRPQSQSQKQEQVRARLFDSAT